MAVLKMLAALIIILVGSCAKEVAPTGGPQDTEPPEMIVSAPESETSAFIADRVIFRFDEFFVLKNPMQNIFFNPIINQEVKYKIKGKKLIVFIPDSIRNGQTYSLNLNNAVADLHEGNILPSLQFVFSTGESIDSLSISGQVIDAYSAQPEENVMVYLFPISADSVFLKKQFAYITKTSEGGKFVFQNLPEGDYQLFALSDKDGNHVYNSNEEKPGFYDEPLRASLVKVNDTLASTNFHAKDPLLVFQEKDTVMRVLKASRMKRGLQQIVFSMPVENAQIRMLGEEVADSIFTTLNSTRDTLLIWLINQKADYAKAEIMANGVILDTISLTLKFPSRGTETEDISLKILPQNIFENDRLHYSDTLQFRALQPIRQIKADSIFVVHESDTLQVVTFFSAENPLTFSIVFDAVPDEKYTVFVPQNVIYDFSGKGNDSLQKTIHITDTSYYGKMIISLETTLSGCHFIEIQNVRSNKKYVNHFDKLQDVYIFDGLIPGEYSVRLIKDINCNLQWDSGIFFQRKQSEKVYKLPGRIIVKSNWETEIQWTVE